MAILGAGPAGCIMAAALLDAARARRQKLSIRLYGAAPLWGPDRPLVLDDPSITRLASLGVPLPASTALEGVQTPHGATSSQRVDRLSVVPRDRLVTLLRSYLHAHGVELHEQEVTQIVPGSPLGYVVRVGGASHQADWVILACGAGSRTAAALPGHRPPPTLATCLARLGAPPLEPVAVHLPNESRGDLWVIPKGEGAWAALVGGAATAAGLAGALLTRAPSIAINAQGPTEVSTYWVPDGAGAPALPTLGSALGGPPEGASIAQVSLQAQTIAASLFEGGVALATSASERAARALRRKVRSRRQARGRARRFSPEARDRALARERREAGLFRPVQRALAQEEDLSRGERLAAFLALLFTAIVLLWEAATKRKAPQRRPRSEEIFILEDDPDQAEGLSAFLRSRGFACSTYPNAFQAALATAERHPAAMVIDLALPWIDGAAATRLLEEVGGGGVPVLITSALTHMEETASELVDAEAFFPKPVDLEALVLQLSRHVRPTTATRTDPTNAEARQGP